LTLTVNAHATALLLASVPVHATTVAPCGNRLPDGGTQWTATPGQLSETLALKTTSASHLPGAVTVVMSLGHTMLGGWRSSTFTVKLQRFVLPLASVATQVTGIWPTTNRVPDGGEQTTVAPEQLSLTAVANVTSASHRPVSAGTI
jgi:hypothetical protein